MLDIGVSNGCTFGGFPHPDGGFDSCGRHPVDDARSLWRKHD
jgi:hypothetical protein